MGDVPTLALIWLCSAVSGHMHLMVDCSMDFYQSSRTGTWNYQDSIFSKTCGESSMRFGNLMLDCHSSFRRAALARRRYSNLHCSLLSSTKYCGQSLCNVSTMVLGCICFGCCFGWKTTAHINFLR